MPCKHKLHFVSKIRKCIGHKRCDGLGICMQLGFLNDPKGGGHKDFVYFVCEKCGADVYVESEESKKVWKRGYE